MQCNALRCNAIQDSNTTIWPCGSQDTVTHFVVWAVLTQSGDGGQQQRNGDGTQQQQSGDGWQQQHSGDGTQQQSGDGAQQQQSGDVGSYDRAHLLFWWASTIVLPLLLPTNSDFAFAFALVFQPFFLSVLKGSFLELELGHGLTGAGARLDIWMVFCIQAFWKTAGFDFEISCGWFPLKRDRLRKQQTEAAKKKVYWCNQFCWFRPSFDRFFWAEKEGVKLFLPAATKLLFPAPLIARQLNIEVNDIKAVIVSVFWYV